MPEQATRRWLWGVVALLVCLPACAGVPTSGPVREGEPIAVDGQKRESFIRLLPQPPQEGESPLDLVKGFLDASASFEDNHQVARLHLDRSARGGWDPSSGVVVYDGSEPVLHPAGNGVVVLEAPRVATISDEGQYAVAPPGAKVRAEFRLRRVAGEWRITDLPDGLLLTQTDVTRSFRPVNLYFLDPRSDVLVPDLVYLPLRRPGLATVLTQGLLDGPTDWLAPAVRTAFPRGVELTRDEVPIDGQGAARVDLSQELLRAGPEEREALSAQLVWTLRQLPEVTSVRISAGGLPLSVPGADTVQPRDAWPSFSPDALAPSAAGFFVRRGRLVSIEDTHLVDVPGAGKGESAPLRRPAESLDLRHIAALSPGLDALRTGPLGPGQRLSTRLRGSGFTAPSWDRLDNVWTVDNAGDQPARVWAVPLSGSPRRVEADELGDADVLALRVSRDGTRVAVVDVSGGTYRLLVGRVVRDQTLRIEALRDITGSWVEVRDVAWAAADRLAVLGRDARGVMQAWVADVDGSRADARGSVPGMTSIAAAPAAPGTRPLLVGTRQGEVFQNPVGSSWQRLAEGSDPAYPG